ncbi:MAG: heme oxygenase [Chitinophaga sp.]|nr:heme oxygenase [Chitinophaga sp.]
MSKIEQLKLDLNSTRAQLLGHPIYASINDLSGLMHFTQYHVFAVWDFMSLLKSLQINLTCVQLPWMPKGIANTRYLINEIVAGEESDIDEAGNRISHFELYLKAMQQMGASTHLLDILFAQIQSGKSIQQAIADANIPTEVKTFLQFTFDIVENHPIHVQAAVFTFGREDLIPDMFIKILDKIYTDHPEKVSIFKYYIERHIEVDGGHHSQLAIEMVESLCGDDETKWAEATAASIQSLQVRSCLWDGIVNAFYKA